MSNTVTIFESTVGKRLIVTTEYDADSLVVYEDDIDELIEKLQEHQ